MRIRESRVGTSETYLERVNLAIDYIATHLDEPLRLVEVSRAARFSPFHFHRVFQALVGETLADYVKRLRLDKALSLMAYSRPMTLTEIAGECGFSSSSDFSRCFRQRFGVAPRAFDLKAWRAVHRPAIDAAASGWLEGLHLKAMPAGNEGEGFPVRIRTLPARTVAYIRVANPYKGDGVVRAVHRLVAWAESGALADGQWLGYQWEHPELVPLEQCRYHVAVEVPERFTPKGEIGRFEFPAMTVAEVDVFGGIDLELRAVRWLFGSWLPRSGYVPDDHPAFEAWIGRPFAHGTEYFEIRAQLPVKKG